MIGNQQPRDVQNRAGVGPGSSGRQPAAPAQKRSRAGAVTRSLLRMVAIPLVVLMIVLGAALGSTGIWVDVLLAGGWFAILFWSFNMA